MKKNDLKQWMLDLVGGSEIFVCGCIAANTENKYCQTFYKCLRAAKEKIPSP